MLDFRGIACYLFDFGRQEMAVIRHPLSGGKGFKEVSLYKDYADKARKNLKEEHFFEAILVCSIGLDVLLNTLPDRLLLFSSSKLNDCQKRILEEIEKREFTAGAVLKRLGTACVLDRRLLLALNGLNADRNKIFHPFQGRKVKPGAIVPSSAAEDAAHKFYRKFCHVIDLVGGRSPRSAERGLNQYVADRERTRRRRFSKP